MERMERAKGRADSQTQWFRESNGLNTKNFPPDITFGIVGPFQKSSALSTDTILSDYEPNPGTPTISTTIKTWFGIKFAFRTVVTEFARLFSFFIAHNARLFHPKSQLVILIEKHSQLCISFIRLVDKNSCTHGYAQQTEKKCSVKIRPTLGALRPADTEWRVIKNLDCFLKQRGY